MKIREKKIREIWRVSVAFWWNIIFIINVSSATLSFFSLTRSVVCACFVDISSTGSLRNLHALPSDGRGHCDPPPRLGPHILMTSSASAHHRSTQRHPAFLETDFTAPITGSDYYVIRARDAVRPAHTGPGHSHVGSSHAHTGYSHASRRLGGLGSPPPLARLSMLSPGSRQMIGSHGNLGSVPYPQCRETHPTSLPPQTTTAFVLIPAGSGISRSSRQVKSYQEIYIYIFLYIRN